MILSVRNVINAIKNSNTSTQICNVSGMTERAFDRKDASEITHVSRF